MRQSKHTVMQGQTLLSKLILSTATKSCLDVHFYLHCKYFSKNLREFSNGWARSCLYLSLVIYITLWDERREQYIASLNKNCVKNFKETRLKKTHKKLKILFKIDHKFNWKFRTTCSYIIFIVFLDTFFKKLTGRTSKN